MPIKSRIRTVPHYPKQGVMFRDITTLLKDPVGFRVTINELVNRYRDRIARLHHRRGAGVPVGRRLYPDPQEGQTACRNGRP
jgi:adenine phosphoribosyltransferase